MIKILIGFTLFLFASLGPSYKIVPQGEIPLKGQYFLTDDLKNVYSIDGNKLFKFDFTRKKTYSYSSQSMGKISMVDVSDPLKILLFYKDFNQVIFLDTYLSRLSEPIGLDELGHEQVSTVCSSYKGGFWLYDEIEGKLFYYNRDLQKIHESINISSFLDSHVSPPRMILDGTYIYIYLPGKGILVLDEFGSFNKLIPLLTGSRFQVQNNNIIYHDKNNGLIVYNLFEKKEQTINLPGENISDARLEDDYLFTFDNEKVITYKLVEK